ncbi:MAG: C2H2-type zinc finger protein [Endozoicomonadaceae bacterium]|nr:C2H2-type zinc finger protein [Endozoicomonadaceae bacterium]
MSKTLLKQHTDNVHSNENKKNTHEKTLSSHKNNNKKEKPSICTICKKAFSYQRNLKRHENIVHYMKPSSFECFTCGASFRTAGTLRAHNNSVHTKKSEYKFHCNICQKQFSTKIRLQTHMSSHTNNYNYSCKYCAKTYKHSSSKSRHEKQSHLLQLDKISQGL